ncbi:nucleolar and coiled-body phosphoprotein 1-like [Coffea eugenioides]|uniref:nucleolar and coiled-body phosphoprotein 1-like n=1 Tax=Coffea eugenioides TaxID=49369 RepID=UPI000F6083D8|nr:nucleolar and coiled-body phosphoprotein 1-like [Coffea eugenioides]
MELIIRDPSEKVRTRSSSRQLIDNFALVSHFEPKNVVDALKDENWILAMEEELNQFERNKCILISAHTAFFFCTTRSASKTHPHCIMVKIRGGSTSAGRSFRLRDEDIEIVEPFTKAPKKKIVTQGGKAKQTTQRKLVSQTAEPSDEQMEEQNSEGNTVGGNEEPEQATQNDETVTRSSGKRKRTAKRKSTPQSKKKQSADPSVDQQNEGNIAENQQTPEPSTRKSPRTRTETQNVGASATQTSKGKRSRKDPETVAESRRKNFHETPVTPRTSHDQSDYVSPFTIHPRKSASKSFASNSEVISLLEDLKQHVLLIEDGLMMTMTPAQQFSFMEKRNLLVPPIPENNENAHQKEPRLEPTGPTTDTEATPASSSRPKDKGKAPATVEAYEEDDEETEEEEDPEQFLLARRRPGSSKITI